jgi:hypothetical protein
MSFLAPITGLIAAAVAVPALVLLYFLKLRRRQVTVPSTLLWKRAVQDLQVNSPFQKIRRNLLLLLQLLVLAGLLLAVARPTFRAEVQPGRRVAILIDHSASMNATDAPGGATRLDEARRAALDLIDSMHSADGAGGGAMIVSFAEQARAVQSLSTDVTLLRSAVRSIEPTDQRSRLEEALRLIEPEAAEGGDESLIVYVLSDGGVHDADRLSLRGAELRYVKIGTPDPQGIDNLAFVAFSAQRDYQRPHRVQVFARLANYGPSPVEANVSLLVDGAVARVSPVTVPGTPAGRAEPGTRALQFEIVVPDAALIEVRHDRRDMLEADNAAALVIDPARRLRVLLVTEGNAFLERAIDAVGVQERVNMDPRKYENQDPRTLRRIGWSTAAQRDSGFDLAVFDGYSPQQMPPVPSLLFGAAPPAEGLSIVPHGEGSPRTQVILDWRREHPLMHRVVLDDVLVQEPGRIVMPPAGSVLATAQSGPILAEISDGGVRHVLASFDVLQSNWPFYVSFPVFVQNAVNYLGSGGRLDAGLAFRPGEVVAATVGRDGPMRWRGPVEMGAVSEAGVAVLPMFTRAGVYHGATNQPPPWDRVAVNLLDATESDLRVADELRVGATPVAGQTRTASIRREVWPWFIWAALAVLLVEWVIYTRRMGV